jgi:Tol biopolymer transport system component/tRNA A-37 threonylcarbamoyl transferase component Bud32
MALAPGTRLGPYEIGAPIGAGGMGEVYRARDTKLQRDVAIKVLPEALAHDIERLARLEREARTLASLNHLNIAQIHGLEESAGITALVMELVEGPTLADRIAKGRIPLDEALPIARQIADALEAAHEQGVVHRDLKPANVKVRPDGIAKVLDFGLAKALERVSGDSTDATASPTITSPAMMTKVGVILGTAAYMSPEQAKGRAADRRSDMWAFGCVLYEMLTGTRAFAGDDVSDTLAAVLRAEPDWTALPPETPAPIRRLLRHCLAKDPKVRIADASTARIEIIDVQSERQGGSLYASEGTGRRVKLAWVSALAIVTLTAVGTTVWMRKPEPPASQPLARFTIPLPIGDRFTNPGVRALALSPDGSRLVYAANQRLYVRAIDQLEPTPIRGAEGIAEAAPRNVFFSPDGQWIGFWQSGQLKKIAVTGGTAFVLCAAENPWGASWTTDDTILYGQSVKGAEGIWRVSTNGGTPEHLVKIEPGEIAQRPQLLPGGRAILFTLARRWDPAAAQIVVQSLDTGKRNVVLPRGTDAQYVATGHLVYVLGGTASLEGPLFAMPFDATTLAVTGKAVALAENVATSGVAAQFTVSNEGTLVYVPLDGVGIAPDNQQRTLVWIDRAGREYPVNAPARPYFYPRLSPDGTHVAVEIREPELQQGDIWIFDLARDTLTRLTLEPTFDQYGVWTPDGQSVIFASSQAGGPRAPRSLFRIASDGAGTVEQLAEGAVAQFPSTVTRDGAALIFRAETPPPKLGAQPGMDLLLLPLSGEDRRARPLVQTPFNELNAEVSQDGHWLAYQSNKSGRDEIYVRPFPNVENREWMVSIDGGKQPLWARNGRELFYVSKDTMMRVTVTTDPTFAAAIPRKLFANGSALNPPSGGGVGRMYEASTDGQRFLMLKESGATEAPRPARMTLVQNWFEELKRVVPTK